MTRVYVPISQKPQMCSTRSKESPFSANRAFEYTKTVTKTRGVWRLLSDPLGAYDSNYAATFLNKAKALMIVLDTALDRFGLVPSMPFGASPVNPMKAFRLRSSTNELIASQVHTSN